MKILALIISFLICFTELNAQSLDSLKHITIVTELQDSMALINNDDINIINKVFYERDLLDSLNSVNDTLIRKLDLVRINQDNIISKQKAVIQNDSLIKIQYKLAIDDRNKIIQDNQKVIKNQKNQKVIWQSTTGALAIALLVVLLI